jgi:hypothetical protein
MGSMMRARTYIRDAQQRQTMGSTSYTFAISLAHAERRSED